MNLLRGGIQTALLLLLAVTGATGPAETRAEEPSRSVAEPTKEPSPVPSVAPQPGPTPTAEAPPSAEVPDSWSKWSGGSGGIILGFSPLYFPKMAGSDRFNSGILATFEGGVELQHHGKIVFRYSKGTVPSLEVYDPTNFTTTYFPGASLAVFALDTGFDIPLNEPYEKLGPFQLFLPLQIGSALASVSGGSSSFSAASFDSALGVGAHFYTRTFFRAELTALYHFSFPLTDFSGGSSGSPNTNVLDPAGETMRAGLSGFELRLGITLLFPGSRSSEAAPADKPLENKK